MGWDLQLAPENIDFTDFLVLIFWLCLLKSK